MTSPPVDPSVRQVSGNGPDGLPVLSVLARRSYAVDRSGTLVPSGEPSPLVERATPDPENPDLLVADADLWPWKPMTDVIVLGHAYGDQPHFTARIAISLGSSPRLDQRLAISGERRAEIRAGGIVFTPSTPPPEGRVPLSLTLSYGGHDLASEAELGNPFAPFAGMFAAPVDAAEMSPFRYPRNPWGRGFVVRSTAAAIAAARLPQIEDPLDLLTPERFIVDRPARWPVMPLPLVTGWLPYTTFVRMACVRMISLGEKPKEPLAEVARGWLPKDILDHAMPNQADAFRLTQGAWPSLRCAPLQGGESVVMENLHPQMARWVFTLPTRRPDLRIDGRSAGKVIATKPVIHTLIIEPDLDRVTVVWRGTERAKRPYTEDELKRMPFVARFD